MTDAPEIPADYEDLLQIPVGAITTIGPTGYPQSSAVWFLYEDGLIKVSLREPNQKVTNARVSPKGTYLFIDPANPYRTLEVRGDLTVEVDTDVAFLRRQLAKYGTTPEEFGRGTDNRVVLTLTPKRVRVWG